MLSGFRVGAVAAGLIKPCKLLICPNPQLRRASVYRSMTQSSMSKIGGVKVTARALGRCAASMDVLRGSSMCALRKGAHCELRVRACILHIAKGTSNMDITCRMHEKQQDTAFTQNT